MNKKFSAPSRAILISLYVDECLPMYEIADRLINKIRDDNRKENLLVMTKSEHMSLHSKERWEAIKNA